MPLQSIDDYLAQRSSGTSVIQALTTLREQAIAEKFEILGCRCTWNLWGGDRQSDGDPLVIPAPALLYLLWRREPDTDDIVLTRHAFERRRGSMLPGGIAYVHSFGGTAASRGIAFPAGRIWRCSPKRHRAAAGRKRRSPRHSAAG
jgi:hypothetical protein